MTQYSSYKSHQLITENWRKFINEETSPWEDYAMGVDVDGELRTKLVDMAERQLRRIAWESPRVEEDNDVHLKIEEVMLGVIDGVVSGKLDAEDDDVFYGPAEAAGLGEHLPPKGTEMRDMTGYQELMHVADMLVLTAAKGLERGLRGDPEEWTVKAFDKVRPWGW